MSYPKSPKKLALITGGANGIGLATAQQLAKQNYDLFLIDKDEEKQKDREKNSRVSSGLRDAVKEVLAEYQPRSSERIPFYCRVCAVQSKDEAEFTLHKQTEFHKTAVQVEKKATYCKLCRKQLTSLIQMQEHLDSRPHKERLDSMKARQQGFSGRGFGRGGSAAGRGNRYVQVNKERPGRR